MLALAAVGTGPALAADARVANTELQVMGIGMAQELRTDIYLGAIFAPADVKTIDAAMADNVPKRMSIKIVAEKWSARELGRTIKERIALNNPRPIWQAQGANIVALGNTFKDNLVRGDTVNFDHVPGVGTEISINGSKLNTIRSTSFFVLLMNAWVGDLPPSQAFKAAVAGTDNKKRNDYINQYDSLQPMPGRTFTAVAAAEPEAKPADKKADGKTVAAAAAGAAVVASKPESKPAEVKPEPKPETKVAETKPEPKPEPKPAKVEQKPVEVAPVALAALDIPAVEAVVDPDLLLGDYKREAMKSFRKNQFYPPKAFKDKLTGEGMVRVAVDKNGNLVSVDVVESTGERLLDKAMLDMVNKSMPLAPLPPELTEDSYNIDIPVRFVL